MRSFLLKMLFFWGLSVLVAKPVEAQELQDSFFLLGELEEVIVRENRIEIPFSASSRNIQILNREDIARLPVSSVQELLAFVTGVDIRQRGPFGGQADISIDGSSFEQTLVLLNGIKLMDSQTAHNMMNMPVPIEAIEHIEVLRGAAARVYGINALAGAVNIVTRKDSTSSISADLYSGSSFRTKDQGDGKGIYGGGGLQLTGNYGKEGRSHLFSFSQDLYNGQRYNTASDNTKLFYNGNHSFSKAHDLQALAGYVHHRFGANGFYAAPGDKDSEEIVETALFSLSSRHQLGRWTIQPRISDRYNRDDYRYFKHDLNTARSIHYSNTLMLEVNGSVTSSIGTFGLGWESRLEEINSSNMGKHERTNHGIYTEYRGFFRDKWNASAGAYINYNSEIGWQVYPGIDVAYFLNDDWKISASAGSGQRIPSFTDMYINQLPGNIGNPEVVPENARNFEINVRYKSEGSRVQAGYLYRSITDFIDWVREDAGEPYSPLNFGENNVHGLYGQLNRTQNLGETGKITYDLGYNYLRPRISDMGLGESKYVLESLRHQLIAGLRYDQGRFSVQVSNRLIRRELNEAYDLLDLRLRYSFRSAEIYTDISNLLDAEYKEAGAVPMPSRWFKLGVRFQWR